MVDSEKQHTFVSQVEDGKTCTTRRTRFTESIPTEQQDTRTKAQPRSLPFTSALRNAFPFSVAKPTTLGRAFRSRLRHQRKTFGKPNPAKSGQFYIKTRTPHARCATGFAASLVLPRCHVVRIEKCLTHKPSNHGACRKKFVYLNSVFRISRRTLDFLATVR